MMNSKFLTPVSLKIVAVAIMAFAPLCMVMDVEMNNPEVVEKSYPSFWTDVAKSGIEIIKI